MSHVWCAMKGMSVAGIICVAAVLSAGAGRADDWPQWRGPDRNGISRETGWTANWPKGGPKVLWRAEVGAGYSSFAVADGRVYTMGHAGGSDTVYCFGAETGKVIWKRSYACSTVKGYGGPRASPTVDGKRVYTLSRDGHLNCFEADSGKVVWTRKVPAKPPTWGFASSPLVSGKLVVVNTGSAGMAFSKTTGRPAWSNGKGKAGYASPVELKRGSKTELLIFTSNALVGVNATSGRRSWSLPWDTKHDVNAADPVVEGDRVFISSGYNVGCALLSVARGRIRPVWRNTNMRNHFNSTVLWKDALYGFDESVLRCLDFKTGEVKWSQRGLGKASLMISDGKLIILSERGELVVAEASTFAFRPLGRAQVLRGHCWTVPVLANGRIYCRTDAGSVVCVDVTGK